jgi:hypothetical protein
MSPLLKLVLTLVTSVFQRVANDLWDVFWLKLFESITEAENKWQESGQGQQKKAWVAQNLTTFILQYAEASGKQLSWLDKKILSIFVSKITDVVLEYINNSLGHDWRAKAEELEQRWAAALPIID